MGELTRFNSLFDDAFFNQFFAPRGNGQQERSPAIDVHESEQGYAVKVDLPGVRKEDISVSLENGILSIQATTCQEDKQEKDGKLIRQERHVGHYTRRLSVGEDIDPAAIKARFEDGVLQLDLPKPQQKTAQAVNIDIG